MPPYPLANAWRFAPCKYPHFYKNILNPPPRNKILDTPLETHQLTNIQNADLPPKKPYPLDLLTIGNKVDLAYVCDSKREYSIHWIESNIKHRNKCQ